MIVDSNVIQLLRESIGAEFKVCNFEDYYQGNSNGATVVRDIVEDSNNIIILI